MYKAFSPSAIKDLEEQGTIDVAIKAGWEMCGSWSAKPSYICFCIGPERERIFSCYFHRELKMIQITNVEPTKLIKDEKALVDAYMYVALRGLIEFAGRLGAQRLIVDSDIPSAADHMFDLGFKVVGRDDRPGGRGYKVIED